MTDRAPPKSKKTKAAKEPKSKKTGPKLVTSELKGIGHNSGEVVPGLVNIVKELLALNEQKKSIGKAERDLRNRAKSEFGVLSGPLAHEMRLRKMDEDVRQQFESAHKDLKAALGYQPELDFVHGVATRTTAQMVPNEAELNAKKADKFEVADEEDEVEVEEEIETEEDAREVKQGGVISREG